MADPFEKATHRLTNRLGKEAIFTPPDSEPLPAIKGNYSGPEEDTLVKGRNGGLVLKSRSARLLVYQDDIDRNALNKQWQIYIPHIDQTFYPIKNHADGSGGIIIQLGHYHDDQDNDLGESHGSKWR